MDKGVKIALLIGIPALVIGTGVFFYIKRNAISKVSRKAIDLAKAEFEDWNKNDVKKKEGDSSVFPNIKKYWEEGAGIFWSKDRMINEAWSSAFISYLMKKSGAGENFKYSPSHSVYIRQSIKNKKEENKNPFKGYRPKEVKVKKGDLVCYARQVGVGYDTTGAYKSHCDFIIDVKKGKAIGVGGNVSNSVSKTEYKLDGEGKMNVKKVFVIIKN